MTLEQAIEKHRNGDIRGALLEYAAQVCLSPSESLPSHLVGVGLHQLGHSLVGLKWLRRAVAVRENDAQLQHNLGEAAWACGQWRLAESSYRLALGYFPDLIDSRISRALVLLHAGDFDEAAREVHRALSALPASPRAHLAEGLVAARGVSFGRAVSIDPAFDEGWTNLGAAALREGSLRAALRAIRRGLILSPASGESWVNFGSVQLGLGFPREAVASQRRGLAGRCTAPLHSNLLFSMLSDFDTGDAHVLAEATRWSDLHCRPSLHPNIWSEKNRDPDRPLVVGYVSGDFRRSPIAGNVEELIARHDKQQYSVCCYAEVGGPDVVTSRFRMYAERWLSTVGVADEDCAAAIKRDSVDVLVFLGGHTAAARLGIAGHRPAPVQVSFHAPSTTGIAAIDYWLSDCVLTPRGWDDRFVERVWRLPNFYTFQAPSTAPDVIETASDDVVLGSFNNPNKLNAAVLAAWNDILTMLPESRLKFGYHNRFEDPLVRQRVLSAFGGDAGGRIDFLSASTDDRDHFDRVGRADIILDTFPFSGATSTFEALWMGTPVVTLAGQRFVGRVGAAILPLVGLGDLVVDSTAKYIEAVVMLARNRRRRNDLRQSLRPALQDSALLNYEFQARALESAFRAMWRRWCAKSPRGGL